MEFLVNNKIDINPIIINNYSILNYKYKNNKSNQILILKPEKNQFNIFSINE